MIRLRRALLFLPAALLVASLVPFATASTFSGVERIVAVGDVHGDYEQFRRVLLDAGIINKRNRWIAGDTHLVQLGDIPDRGPDTLEAIKLLQRLQKQAERSGGRVHALIGNHEALNMIGDLRYVHPGEYAAFKGRNSRRLQTAYYNATVEHLKNNLPEDELPVFDDAFEEDFRNRHPLGYVEHRRAWAPGGDIGSWVLQNNTVVRINDTLFVHGGLSGKYAELSLEEINESIRRELAAPQAASTDAVIDDSEGPLWYRGLTTRDDRLDEENDRVARMLEQRSAKRIVVAHTPVTGAVLPRFDARVIGIDVGLSAHYGGRLACLVIEGDDIYALHRGTRLDLPASDEELLEYLAKAASLDPPPSPISRYIQRLKDRPPPVPEVDEVTEEETLSEESADSDP